MKIKSLSIKSFRGATKPLKVEFDPSKNITMIFGENGNGKTTISDALVCLCRDGEYGSIQDKPSIDKSYLCSIGAQPQDAEIELETDAAKFVARLNAKPLGSFSKFPMEGFPNLRYLRRKQIIGLLEDNPSQRYEKFQEYIDVSAVMASEDALRKLVKTTKNDLASETKSLTDSTNTLERVWEEEKKPMGSWEEWATTESQKDISEETKRHAQLSETITQWQQVENKFNTIKQQRTDLKTSEEKVITLKKELAKIESEKGAGNMKLLSVLESAQNFIVGEELLDHCPVCKNTVEKESLVKSIESQINAMKTLQQVSRDMDAAEKLQERSKAVIESSQKEFNTSISAWCKNILVFVGKETASEKLFKDLQSNAQIERAFDSYESNVSALSEFMTKVTAKASAIYGTIKQFNLIRENYKTITRVRDGAESLEKLLKASEKTLKIVEATRKKFIEDSLNAVSTDIEAMYNKMHPGEGLGDIRLYLKTVGKSSIEISSTFHTEKEVTPQSLYSESHLDTLGICIFIALAKKYNEGDTILLLDDVIMSVDDKHLDRFVDLLHTEADNFDQIILTTHYRPWRDRYRTHRAPGGKVHFIELRNWTRESGIQLQNGRVEILELELALNDKSYFDRQVIASKSGILLENLLDYLTDIYEYHLPKRKTLKYTLGELIDTLQPKYLKNIKAVHTTITQVGGKEEKVETQHLLQPVIEDLKRLIFIRNQVGAHFNLDQDASDDDVMLFGKKTLELGEILVCKQTGQLPLTKYADHWRSKQGTVKLFPAEKV